jgi:hypothetical protein
MSFIETKTVAWLDSLFGNIQTVHLDDFSVIERVCVTPGLKFFLNNIQEGDRLTFTAQSKKSIGWNEDREMYRFEGVSSMLRVSPHRED